MKRMIGFLLLAMSFMYPVNRSESSLTPSFVYQLRRQSIALGVIKKYRAKQYRETTSNVSEYKSETQFREKPEAEVNQGKLD